MNEYTDLLRNQVADSLDVLERNPGWAPSCSNCKRKCKDFIRDNIYCDIEKNDNDNVVTIRHLCGGLSGSCVYICLGCNRFVAKKKHRLKKKMLM